MSISIQFIHQNPSILDWTKLAATQELPEEFMREFEEHLDWDMVSTVQRMSEDFMREFKDRLNWNKISAFQTLYVDFIREFKDRVSWDALSEVYPLYPDYVDEHKDRLNWRIISNRMDLTEDFIVEHADRIHWDTLATNPRKFSEDMEKLISEKISVKILTTDADTSLDPERQALIKLINECAELYKDPSESGAIGALETLSQCLSTGAPYKEIVDLFRVNMYDDKPLF